MYVEENGLTYEYPGVIFSRQAVECVFIKMLQVLINSTVGKKPPVVRVVDQRLLPHPSHLDDQPVKDLLPLLVEPVAIVLKLL